MTEHIGRAPEEARPKEPLVLIVSTKFDPHVDIIIDLLNKRRAPFIRFNTEDFPLNSSISAYLDNNSNGTNFNLPQASGVQGSDITSVWYRRPGPHEFPEYFSSEARTFADKETRSMFKGVWSLVDCLWVNDPEKNQACNIKLRQLKAASNLGLNIPKTLVTNDPDTARKFFDNCHQQMIIKPFAGGLVGEDFEAKAIYTSVVKESDVDAIETVKFTPVLLQEYVPKKTELRVTIVGENTFCAEIESQRETVTSIDWRRDPYGIPYQRFELPGSIEKKCQEIVHSFGLNFGAIDMILTPNGEFVFLEINPNGQWAWIEDLTGMPIASALTDLLVTKST